jgi:type II secretory pathway predicted ATPase ExeA/phage tail protein X
MYESYFGFSESPFENNLDQRFLFLGKNHKEVLAALLYFMKEKKGFALVCGDVGTGKTMLLNYYLAKLPKSVRTVSISNPEVDYREILFHIARNLGIQNTNKPVLELLEEVRNALIEVNAQGQRFILMIDEAHLLPDRSLEHIRLLSNIESQEQKLLQILLVGQNELSPKLNRTEMRQLRQRININRFLGPLDEMETIQYVNHRLKVVGSGFDSVFEPQCKKLLFKMTEGIPRRINHLCDNALLISSAERQKKISTRILKKAYDALRSDLLYIPGTAAREKRPKPMAGARALVMAGPYAILAILVFFLLNGGYFSWKANDTAPKTPANVSAALPDRAPVAQAAPEKESTPPSSVSRGEKQPLAKSEPLMAANAAPEPPVDNAKATTPAAASQTPPPSSVASTGDVKTAVDAPSVPTAARQARSNAASLNAAGKKPSDASPAVAAKGGKTPSESPSAPVAVQNHQSDALASTANNKPSDISEAASAKEANPPARVATVPLAAPAPTSLPAQGPLSDGHTKIVSNKAEAGLPAEAKQGTSSGQSEPKPANAVQPPEVASITGAVPEAPGGPREILIKRGDTLTSIALQWYPDRPGTAIDEILKANPTITNRNLILEGQPLILPKDEPGAKAPARDNQSASVR